MMQLHSNDAFRWSCRVKTVTREYASLVPRFRTFLAEFAAGRIIHRGRSAARVMRESAVAMPSVKKTRAALRQLCQKFSRINRPAGEFANEPKRSLPPVLNGTHSAGIAR